MVAPLSDSWTDGRDDSEMAFVAWELKADWFKSRRTGETLMT